MLTKEDWQKVCDNDCPKCGGSFDVTYPAGTVPGGTFSGVKCKVCGMEAAVQMGVDAIPGNKLHELLAA